MGFFLVLKAEIVRTFIIMRRYWFATLTGIIIGYGLLVGMIFAFMYSRESLALVIAERAKNATNISLGLIIGMYAFGIVGMFTQGLQGMARTGELEQLCMSPHGLVTNFLARSLVSSVSTIFSCAIMITLVAATVKGTLHADPVPMVLLLFLTYINLIGFGFMAGGLALVFKQTGQVAVLIRLGLMAMGVGASEKIAEWPAIARWIAHSMPITDAAICLKHVLIQGQQSTLLDENGDKVIRETVTTLDTNGNQLMVEVYETVHLSVFSHPSFYYLLISCVIWTTVGITCFRFLENWSRTKGTLGAY